MLLVLKAKFSKFIDSLGTGFCTSRALSSPVDQAWFLPAMLIRVSVWSIQKTHDFVVFCPLMIPSTTSSRSSALVLSQFFSPDLIRTFSTSIGIGAPERTCSILSRSVSLDLFGRLSMFLALGLWPGLYPQAPTIARVVLDICIM